MPFALEPADESGFALRFFPVFDLQRDAVVALFCRPTIDGLGTDAIYGHEAFRAVTPLDWARIDCMILDEAVGFAERLARDGIAAVGGASVSFATLSDPRGRHDYREALRAIALRGQAAPLIKIEDIPDRTGPGRIGEIVHSLKTLVPRLWVHVPGSHVPIGAQGPLHVRGLVLSMPPALPRRAMEIEARWLAKQAVAQSALACMDRVTTGAELETVRLVGIRYATGAALKSDALAREATAAEIRDALAQCAAH